MGSFKKRRRRDGQPLKRFPSRSGSFQLPVEWFGIRNARLCDFANFALSWSSLRVLGNGLVALFGSDCARCDALTRPPCNPRWSLQNRPTGRGQDLRLFYRFGGSSGKCFFVLRLAHRASSSTNGRAQRVFCFCFSFIGRFCFGFWRGRRGEAPAWQRLELRQTSSAMRITECLLRCLPPFWCASSAGRT
jgi:hypothetical protein